MSLHLGLIQSVPASAMHLGLHGTGGVLVPLPTPTNPTCAAPCWQPGKAYRHVLVASRLTFERQQQVQLLDSYFSETQRDFWRAFNSGKALSCPKSNIAAWTQHFIAILGQQPAPLQLSDSQQATKDALLTSIAVDPGSMNQLNAPVTVEEVAAVMQSLPTSKAADCQGLSCELLKYAARPVESGETGHGNDPGYECNALVECVTHVVSDLMAQQGPAAMTSVPEVMQIASLAPVPKPMARADPLNCDLYRGIAVGSIFKRVLTRVLKHRADSRIESLGLRAPTQCGFREGHGCLDALFTLQHLIAAAREDGDMLWVVFVDFKKAFDSVRRDLLIERCMNLGINGEFLQALCMLYDKVIMRVKVNGRLGEPFDTFLGTEQGSELSPLLFGLFMDLLYELLKLQVPGAGPILGNTNISNLMYADDVNLISRSPNEMQQLLDCLDVLCYIFDMHVNLNPHKTCCVVFRRAGVPIPAAFRPGGGRALLFRGQSIAIKPGYTYLGLWLDETKNMTASADILSEKGRNAMHALLPRLRQHFIAQFNMRGRLFDILVELVLSYGAQIWGPLMLRKRLFKRGGAACLAYSLNHHFLCTTAGMAPKGKDRDMVLREFHRISLLCRWALLVASWW